MNKNRFGNVVHGILLLLIAAMLVMYKLDVLSFAILDTITVWQLIFGICLVYCLFHSLFTHRSITGVTFSIALLGIVFAHELGIEKLVPWTILIAAMLISIALNMIFETGHKGRHHGEGHNFKEVEISTVEGDVIREKVSFTGATKYIHSDNFVSADLDCSFCGAEFYFDKVVVPSKQAEININSRFCGLSLFFPREWVIVNEVNSTLGAVDFDNYSSDTVSADAVTIVLKGSNSFAGVEIHRV